MRRLITISSLRRLRLLPVIALICLITSACSDDSTPSLTDIPADADYAVILDLSPETIGDNPTDLLPLLVPADLAAQVEKAAGAIDLSHILIYKPAETRMEIVGLTVTDPDALTTTLTDGGWVKRKYADEECYSPESSGEFGCCIIMDGAAAWYLASKADIKNWRESRRQASYGKNLGSRTITDYCLNSLSPTPAMVKAFVNPTAIGLSAQQSLLFVASESSADRKTLTLKARMIGDNDSGESAIEQLGLLAPLGSDASAYSRLMTPGPALRLAAGIPSGTNWGGLVEMAGSGLGTQNQGMLQSLLPYMNRLDGTIAICVGPLTVESLTADDIERQTLLIFATLEGSASQEAVNEINTNLRDKGLTPTPLADGVYSFSLPDATYRYTARDSVFIFALNREIEPAASVTPDALTATPDTRLTASLTLPPIPTGITAPRIDLKLLPDVMTLTICSDSANPLSTLLKYFAALRQSNRSAREASPDYYDTYD